MKNTLIIPLFFASVLSLWSCNSKETATIEISSTSEEENQLLVSKTQFESSKMKLGGMESQDFHEVIKANGMFDVPPENQAAISSYFGGIVKTIQLITGEKVKKGQTLFTLENPEFVQMQQDYLEAKGQLTYLKSDYERQKNFLKAESDYIVTQVKMEGLAKKLALMNINPSTLSLENIRSTINIISPIDGYVTGIDISRGSSLNSTQAAITLVNTDHMHLELSIFEKDLAKVRIGQKIVFTLQNESDKQYEAVVHLINKTISPENRSIGILGYLIDDKLSSQFAPGMYIQAEIYATSASKLALPENAIVEMDDKHYVLTLENLNDSEYVFSQKEVQIGETNDGFTEIINAKDFDIATKFLVDGAFNLITE